MKNYLNKILLLKSNTYAVIAWVFFGLIILCVWFLFLDMENVSLTFWQERLVVEIILHILLSILFGFFVSLQVYKITTFKKLEKKSVWWRIWWVIGTIITGCPVCGVTLMSYLGIASLLSFLPRYWLELKILWLILLVITNEYMLKNIAICNKKDTLPSFLKKPLNLWIFTLITIWILVVFSVLFQPQTSIKLKNYNIRITPPIAYNIFEYTLQEWCSNKEIFFELYTKTSQEISLGSIDIYTPESLTKFESCKGEYFADKQDMQYYQNQKNLFDKNTFIVWNPLHNRPTSPSPSSDISITFDKNWQKYIVEEIPCEDYQYENCQNYLFTTFFGKNKIDVTVNDKNTESLWDKQINAILEEFNKIIIQKL